jgi:hypothetical protein
MIESQKLQAALNSKGYKTEKGRIKALKTLAKSKDAELAFEATTVLEYNVKRAVECDFEAYLEKASKILGKRPAALTRAQVKSVRQKFEAERE